MNVEIERKELVKIKLDADFIGTAIREKLETDEGIKIMDTCPISFMSGSQEVKIHGAFIEFFKSR